MSPPRLPDPPAHAFDDDVDLNDLEASRPDEEPSFMQQLGEIETEPRSPAAEADPHAPHAKRAQTPLNPNKKADHIAHRLIDEEDRQEALLDEGVEETFPASDPVSVKRIT
jgi:hypothetical protein